MTEKRFIDWELIERAYRAGIKTLRQIGEEFGVSHTAINKKAKELGWTRDLTEKIQQRAQSLVTKAEVSKVVSSSVSKERQLSDAETVSAYSDIVANIDMTQRSDVKMAMDTSRQMLVELASLSRPEVMSVLEWMAENFDESNGPFKDKANELYRYIISLPGRIKMAKELAATHGVYVPLQRKIYKLDEDSKTSGIDDLLLAIGGGK